MPKGGHGGHGGSGGGTIRGSNRDDAIVGTGADDIIFGRNGDDTIDAGAGSDTVTGGAGADVFVVDATTQRLVITDFEDGIDRIDVSALGIDPDVPWAGAYGGYLADADGDTYLRFYDLVSNQMVAEIVLENFDYTRIDPGDYIL